jgi:hypothetical protein
MSLIPGMVLELLIEKLAPLGRGVRRLPGSATRSCAGGLQTRRSRVELGLHVLDLAMHYRVACRQNAYSHQGQSPTGGGKVKGGRSIAGQSSRDCWSPRGADDDDLDRVRDGEQDRSSDGEDYLQGRRFRCVISPRAGAGSGHRIVKWFTVSRQC